MGAYRLLIPFLRPGVPALVVGTLLLMTVDFLQLMIPRFIKGAVDVLSGGPAVRQALLGYVVRILVLALVIFLLRTLWRRLIFGQARRIEEALRNRLLEHLFRLSPAFFRKRSAGDLMAHATNDLEAVRMALGMGLVSLVDSLFLGSAAMAFMVYINPTLTVFSLLPMPLVAYLTYRLSQLFHHRFESVQAIFSGLMEKVRESLVGILVIKAYNLQDREIEKLSGLSRRYLEQNLKLARITGTLFPLSLFLTNLSLAVVLWMGGGQVIRGEITVGDFVAFISYLGLLGWPVMALGWVVNLIKRGSVSLGRIDRILREQPEVADGSEGAARQEGVMKIEVRQLTFSYPDRNEPALSAICLKIVRGEQIVLTGSTGSGKSTLAALLVRWINPPVGTVFLDDRPVESLSLSALRSQVGLVPQEAFLFSDTIRSNLLFGKPEASEEELGRVLEAAALAEEVRHFPGGLDTVVGEKGVLLSGGQKQRLALARALLADPPFLILDNTLAAVDLSTERRILAALARQRRGRTTLYISHRLVGWEHLDRICLLERGRIVESGSHAELVRREGPYARLYRRQCLERELEEGGFVHAAG